MKRLCWYVLLCVGCAHEDGSSRALPGDPDYCEATLDDPTPLGITGADLLALYGGEFAVDLVQRRGFSLDVVARDTVSVRIELREDDDHEAARCGALALPVTVTLRGAIVDEVGEGALVGDTRSAFINFIGEGASRRGGSVRFEPGQREVSLTNGEASWSSEAR